MNVPWGYIQARNRAEQAESELSQLRRSPASPGNPEPGLRLTISIMRDEREAADKKILQLQKDNKRLRGLLAKERKKHG